MESNPKPILMRAWKHSLICSTMFSLAKLFKSLATEEGSVLHECGEVRRKGTISE
jgi:hypothetical protein